MAKFRLALNTEIDLLDKDELDAALNKHWSWSREAAYGLKHFGLPMMTGAIAGGAVIIGGTQVSTGQLTGPREGFVWKVTRVSVGGLTNANDALALYKGDPAGSVYVTMIGTAAFLPGKGLILHPGQYLTLEGSGLATTGTLFVTGEYIQAPAELIWKLID